jgi:hypothetical protein
MPVPAWKSQGNSSQVRSKHCLVVFPNIGPLTQIRRKCGNGTIRRKHSVPKSSFADPLPIGQSCTVTCGLCHSKMMRMHITWSLCQRKTASMEGWMGLVITKARKRNQPKILCGTTHLDIKNTLWPCGLIPNHPNPKVPASQQGRANPS